MRRAAICLLVMGACDGTAFDSVEQQVADPAPTLSITNAAFHSPIGGADLSFCGHLGGPACPTAPPVQVRWGTPADFEQSGLGFQAGGAHVIVYEESFPIGTLTHFNVPTISGTSASGVSLDVHLRVDPSIPGVPLFDQAITIPLAIDDTLNVEPCAYPSAVPCSDKITFGTSTFDLASTADNTIYELEILGFVDAATNTTVDGLISEENLTSSAALLAVVRQHCVDEDADGACDETDNCSIANADQADSDGDGQGDACDACPNDAQNDVDGDGVCGNVDNCPTIANPEQGFECLCPCDAPWKNHGEYVSCVAHETNNLVNQGLLTHQERSVMVSTAGQSACGK